MRQIIVTSALAVALAASSAAFWAVPVEGRQAQPAGGENLGTVTIGRQVMADGKPLRPGTYRLRLTEENAAPMAKGQTASYERWVEFVRGGKVVAREVVSIVPSDEIKDVAESSVPRAGTAKVELLKGNEYLRIWVNRGGYHYLIHLPAA